MALQVGKLLIEANWSDQKKDINFAYECFKLKRLKQKIYSHTHAYSCCTLYSTWNDILSHCDKTHCDAGVEIGGIS